MESSSESSSNVITSGEPCDHFETLPFGFGGAAGAELSVDSDLVDWIVI